MKTRGLTPLLAILLIAAPALAQERDDTLPRVSPNASMSFQLGITDVSVTYGAPSVRDRTIFGELVPYGEPWRTGANEATTISFSTDVLVEGQPLAAGTYMLATIPGRNTWTVVFNSQAGQWGTYQYDPAHDVLRVEATPRRAPARETLAITFDNYSSTDDGDAAEIVIHWADYRLPIRVEAETARHLEARADAAMTEGDWRRPFTFARYALQTGRHMDKALEWVDAAVQQEHSYSTMALRARLLAAHERYAEATEAGQRALALADAMDEAPRDAAALRDEMGAWRTQGS